jgi:hypothetical protein
MEKGWIRKVIVSNILQQQALRKINERCQAARQSTCDEKMLKIKNLEYLLVCAKRFFKNLRAVPLK